MLDDWEKTRLNQLFYRCPEFGRAWVFKEGVRAWYKERDRSKDEERLGLLEQRINNGFVEGKNNRIKTIRRTAYGYRNMDNFRIRVLADNLDCVVRVSHLLT